ncbi:hypothetical protein Htur_4430 (plasmid) [Haloterrigena turkmenica DSM 5511]|uniref:Uncharacterized protein n=1 Tax=Haloterrigena turkmenica (strain ATCC 51198 / DSM 5511 / JCM 9101 / NCIMB 13204 / VKM B-1734 / 4k) TaxID=543526 RepID=D2S1J4_HALTV|nr:hypothetical protein [Haloterrigena turkmenica]ADB63241.1 hypothetical protein Htur_4430 [Haloterrigena turkmenica DSM 5511]
MGSTQRANDPETTSQSRDSILEPLFDSLLLKIAAAGAALVALGAILNGVTLGGEGELMGLWAAIFAVWGSGLILVGLGLYSFVWWRRR